MNSTMKDLAYVSLGRGDKSCLLINVILPVRTSITNLTCEVFTIEGSVHSQTVPFEHDIVRLFHFEFHGLKDGTKYFYRFLEDEVEIDLGEGLLQEDLFFTYYKNFTGPGEAILMSCNGLFDFKGPEKHRYRMWERLLELSRKVNLKILLLGGDQYYQDKMEKEWLSKLTDKECETNYLPCLKASLANALEHMSHPAYRKLMAQTPSMAMLDDHDITDGTGGRTESFDGTEFKPEWKNFIQIQKDLFRLLQASRNPTPVSAFTVIQDLGETAVVALDMRTEKNATKKILMEKESQEKLFNAIRALPHKNVHILLPVVPMRNSIKFEGVLNLIIQMAYGIASMKSIQEKFPRIVEGLKHITGSSDDLNDSLISEVNRDFFTDLIKLLAEGSKRGVNYSFLSGDIHTGGITEIYAQVDGHQFHIPLIISSPIGYEPMPWFVEVVLREKNEMEFEHKGISLKAVNGRFTTKRNFMLLKLNQIFSHPSDSVVIFEEAIEGARKLSTKEWLIDGLPDVIPEFEKSSTPTKTDLENNL